MSKYALLVAMAAAMVAPITARAEATIAEKARFEAMLRTADSGVTVNGRFVQVEYLTCLFDAEAQWFEDGSAIC